MSDSLWLHGLQHARPPCPSLTARVHSNSCRLSQWCHPTISSSIVPFSCLQSFPTSGSFQMSQFFTSGGSLYMHPCPCNWHYFIPFYGWVIFHCVCVCVCKYICVCVCVCVCVYLSHNFFIYSSVGAHLGCSHVLAIVTSAQWTLGCMYLFELWFYLGIFPGVGFLGHMIVLFSVF